METKKIYSEEVLLQQIAKGCRKSFSVLFKMYYPKLGAYLFKITKDEEVVDEIVQETFIKIWTNRSRLSHVNSFEGYILTISKNLALNFIRNKAREKARDQKVQESLLRDTRLKSSPCWIQQYGPIIDQAIDKLPPQQRKVYLLSRHDKLKYTEIATRTGLSIETIRKHMYLALKFLKKEVKAAAEGSDLNGNYFILLNFLLPLF